MPTAKPHDINVISLLKDARLSITEGRKQILGLFMQTSGALAHRDIEEKMGHQYDRVTIYRTLQTFLDKGIIHSIPSADNAVYYALCRDNCIEGHHHDNHVHFICNQCRKTTCLEDVITPSVKLPRGFVAGQVQVVVEGTCAACR